ncbi:hypothetical protein [Natrinema sp. H-ect4]|jgi:amino acid transporter|uniref:hypothetical protein n=1 Tax=Natrinema sp. H-ect4 TaxID=3242699 RepID=UPI0035A92292
MVSERRERAQVILIGAIALAFIILGIVVVFNGVLYTETLSSGGTSQSASDADVIELEIEQGVGCLLERVENESAQNGTDLQNQTRENISAFSSSYQNTTVRSTTTSVNLSAIEVHTSDTNKSHIENASLTIEYYSNSLSYKQNRTIVTGCP